MNDLLESFGKLIGQNVWLAPLLALVSGVLASFTPCSLSSLPLIIAYVGGAGTTPKKAFRFSLVFALGSAVTFTALGVAASLMGQLLGAGSKWWYVALGVLMVVMALQTWDVVHLIPSSYLVAKNTRRGYLGALLAGILGGIFSSPCSTPVLIALLAAAAAKGNALWGAFLLLLYSAGHAALALIAGTSMGFVRKLSQNQRYGRLAFGLKIAMGTAILLIGLYMFYLGF